MTMTLSLLIKGNAASAKAALTGVKDGIKTTKTSTAGLTTETRKAATSNGIWARSTAGVRSSLAGLRSSATAWIAKLRQVDDTQKLAGGSVANLTAQFNDIGVMMAAGQNPLQLAIQQGTQITQVIGPMGATQAVRALGAGFMSLLSPVNLITLGSIAAGAAMVQWLTGAKEDAETLDDVLERLSGTIDDVKDRAGQSAQSIAEEFGAVGPEIARMLGDLREVGLDQLEADARAAAAALRESLSEPGRIQSAFGSQTRRGQRQTAQSRQVVTAVANLEGAEDLEGALEMVQSIRSAMEAAALANGNWTDEQKALKAELVQVERELRRAVVAQGALLTVSQEIGTGLIQSAKDYLQTRIAEQTQAQELLASLQEEKAIRDAIQIHGENSHQVAELRVQAERRVFEQQVDTRDVSQAMKDELLAAWDAANGIAGVNIAGGIAAGADAAQTLAARLGVSLETAQKIAALGPQGAPGPQGPNQPSGGGRGGDPRAQGGSFLDWQTTDAANFDLTYTAPKKSRSSGGSQADETERLIQQLQRELDLLRETDPLQKELIRNRETLAGATEAQKQTVQDLIAEKVKEARATEAQTELTSLLGDTSRSVLSQMADDANNASAALEDLAVSIGAALVQAALLGDGPFGGLFGGSDVGGLVGQWLGKDVAATTSAALPALANGGQVHGPGTSTSDDVLLWGSDGEYMVNAASTRANLPLLEAINSGAPVMDMLKSGRRLQALAAGGMVGGGSIRTASQSIGGSVDMPQLVYVDNTSSTSLEARQETVQDSQGRRSQKLVLADAVGSALQTQGGGASKYLKSVGVRPKGAKR